MKCFIMVLWIFSLVSCLWFIPQRSSELIDHTTLLVPLCFVAILIATNKRVSRYKEGEDNNLSDKKCESVEQIEDYLSFLGFSDARQTKGQDSFTLHYHLPFCKPKRLH